MQIMNTKAMLQPSTKTAILVIRLWVLTLKLYPAAFRAAYADEMLDVFVMSLCESASAFGLLTILWRELRSLPASLMAVYRQAYNRQGGEGRRIQRARWIVRIMGGLLSLFLLSTLRILVSPSYNLYAQAVPFVVALFMACISMLVGLCWGRVGGLLTLASGAAIGCTMTLYIYVRALAEVGVVGSVLIGLVWALPFLIFGVLFYQLSKPPKSQLIPHINRLNH